MHAILLRAMYLRVTHNVDRHIQLLEILLLLVCQLLAPCIKRLVHARDAREADDGARDALVDPGQRDVAHLPVVLLRKLLHALDNLLVVVLAAGLQRVGLFFAF